MSTNSHKNRRIVWDAAHEAVYKNNGAEYNPEFKKIEDERFERLYRQIQKNYWIQEGKLKEMIEVYGEIK